MTAKDKVENFLKGFRRFGLHYCDLKTMLWNIGFLMRANTVNIDKHNTKPIPIIFYITTIIGYICYYYVYIISMVWCVFVHYRQTKSYVDGIIVFSIAIFTETCPIKLLFMIRNRKLIHDVLERYLECDVQIPNGSRMYINNRKHLKVVKRRSIIIWLILMIIAFIHCTGPFFRQGRHFPEDASILYGLQPMTESPNYEIATIIFTITIMCSAYSLANGTAFIIVLFGYTEAQLLSLSEEIINIWKDAEECWKQSSNDEKENIVNNFIGERLKFIAKLHIENIDLVKQVEAVLRLSMALEFLVLTVGIIAALLGGIKNTYLEIPFCFSQIFMSCYVGQKLIDSSKVFENAVYDSKWENFDISDQKTVLIILRNSQKTLKLSAGGVAVLSLECLMSVIKSCYSFYTTLQSTLK